MPPFTIAAAQSSSLRGDIAANVQTHVEFARKAAAYDTDVIIFPELSLSGYEMDLAGTLILAPEDDRLRPLHDLSRRFSMTIIAGAPTDSGLEKPHLGALIFSPENPSVYAKIHLHGDEVNYFSPGDAACVLDIKGTAVGVAICADITHPMHAKNAAGLGAAVYAAGVLLTEQAHGPDTAMMQTYASDHNMLTVLANHGRPTGGWISAGKSAIWDEQGRCIAQADGTEDALVLATRGTNDWQGRIVL